MSQMAHSQSQARPCCANPNRWSIKPESDSHKVLARSGCRDFAFAFSRQRRYWPERGCQDSEAQLGLKPDDLSCVPRPSGSKRRVVKKSSRAASDILLPKKTILLAQPIVRAALNVSQTNHSTIREPHILRVGGFTSR